MTTRADLLRTIEKIEIDIAETSRRPTIIQRLKFFLARKTVATWMADIAKIKAARKEKIKQLRTRKDNINSALSVWLDAGDVIGKYEIEEETNER
jgi:hypothetical protein